jgi:hypothetical protein
MQIILVTLYIVAKQFHRPFLLGWLASDYSLHLLKLGQGHEELLIKNILHTIS